MFLSPGTQVASQWTCHSIGTTATPEEEWAFMALLSCVLQKVYRLTTVLIPQETHPSGTRECHQVQEALLIGLCLSRFGGLETKLYDAIMNRMESSPQGACTKRESAQQC
jgi:hypothetical protein